MERLMKLALAMMAAVGTMPGLLADRSWLLDS